MLNSGAKFVQVVGSSGVSSIASVPGTAQASVTQVFKDFGSEIIGQGVNQLFDGINNMYQQKKYTEERINYYESLYGNKE